MKTRVRRFRAAAALLAVLFVIPAVAEEAPRVANVLIVENEWWQTDLAVVAPEEDATMRISDCNSFGGAYTVPLKRGEGLLLPRISDYQCSRTRLGVVKLRVLSGEPRVWSQASFRDTIGNRNVVMLPTLPNALPASHAELTAEYVFDGIENASALGRSTFVALIPDEITRTEVELSVSSYRDDAPPVTETVTIDGFTVYELKTPVEFGRLTIKHIAPPDGPGADDGGLFAVALVGDREAGSPRVEIPRTYFAASRAVQAAVTQ